MKRDPATGRLSGGNPGNRGGQKGRSGRKPEWYVRWLSQQLTHNKSLRKSVRKILRNPDHPHFRGLLKQIEDRVLGKPKETVDIQGKMTLEMLLSESRKGED